MKKRIVAVLIALFVALIPVTASAVSAGGEFVLGFFCDRILDWMFDGVIPDYLASRAAEKAAMRVKILGIWDDIISTSKISETGFRNLIGGITSEEYYWMFADCNAPIDDIVSYCFGTSDKSGTAFETVKTFVIDNGLSKQDLKDFHNLVYTHRTDVYDFTSNTMRWGVTIDDICVYCFSNGVATDNPTTGLDDNGNVTISGKTFSEICNQLKDNYAPDPSYQTVISWKDDTRYQDKHDLNNTYGDSEISFYQAGTFANKNWSEVYCVPYYYDGSNYYYGQLQLHWFHTVTDGAVTINFQTKDMINSGEWVEQISLDGSKYRYLDVFMWSSGYSHADFYVLAYPQYSDYIKIVNYTPVGWDIDDIQNFYSSDLNSINWGSVWSKFRNQKRSSSKYDYGFIVSEKYIDMGLTGIAPSKIDPNSTITISGDTIYDYTITNSDGDSTTINNYITNNYTIPETPSEDSDDESSGSFGSGDITVSGDIDVGGSIDINVNVSSSSGEGVEFDQDVSLENYYEWMNEETAGFSEFMGGFLSWLPSPIVTLLCCGFGAVVLMRFIGR